MNMQLILLLLLLFNINILAIFCVVPKYTNNNIFKNKKIIKENTNNVITNIKDFIKLYNNQLFIAKKYYFESKNNIFCIIGYKFLKKFSPIKNFEDYNYYYLKLCNYYKDFNNYLIVFD